LGLSLRASGQGEHRLKRHDGIDPIEARRRERLQAGERVQRELVEFMRFGQTDGVQRPHPHPARPTVQHETWPWTKRTEGFSLDVQIGQSWRDS
jgi:hypothetical protein